MADGPPVIPDCCKHCGADWRQLRLDDRKECASCACESRRRRIHGICSLCGLNNRRDGLGKSYCRECHIKFYGWQAWRKGTGTGIERIPARNLSKRKLVDVTRNGKTLRQCRDCRQHLWVTRDLWPWCDFINGPNSRRCIYCMREYQRERRQAQKEGEA